MEFLLDPEDFAPTNYKPRHAFPYNVREDGSEDHKYVPKHRFEREEI